MFKSYKYIMLIASMGVVLNGCNNEGGGAAPAEYTGLTTQASINSNNGQDMGGSAVQNGGSGQYMSSSFGALNYQSNTVASNDGTPKSVILLNAVRQAFSQIDTTKSNTSTNRAAASDSVAGSCGGSMSYSININETTFDFSGTTSFNNYCEGTGADKTTMNGSSTMAGNISGNVTLTYNALTITTASESFTTSGTVVMSFSDLAYGSLGGSITSTMDIKIRDNTTDKTVWLESMTVTVTISNGVSTTVSMSGRFYHPDYGYGDITTPTSLYIAWGDQWPSSGEIIVTGATGALGLSTKVRIVAISNTQYTFEIDADGDGAYDSVATTHNWADLP